MKNKHKLILQKFDFEKLVKRIPDGIIIVDSENLIRFVNNAAQKLMGSSGKDLSGKPLGFTISAGKTRPVEINELHGKQVNFIGNASRIKWQGKEAFLYSIKKAPYLNKTGKITEKQQNALKFALASEKILIEELEKKNNELMKLSITDGLTQLYNHRFIQERLDFEFTRAARYKTALSCMLIDIDHFKNVNDTYGHQCGDFILQEIAGILIKTSRNVDICGRYGGEEFMVVSNVTGDNAFTFASRLHTAIAERTFRYENHNLNITVSIGLANYSKETKTKQELIDRADKALYNA
ncbi:MAG: diguanylate cyclase, partial [bacterium]